MLISSSGFGRPGAKQEGQLGHTNKCLLTASANRQLCWQRLGLLPSLPDFEDLDLLLLARSFS